MPLRRRHRRHAFAVLAAAAAAALTGSLLVAPAAAAPDPSPNGLATPSHPGVVTTTPTLNPTAPFDESQWKQGSLHFNTVFLCIYTCQSCTVAMARVDYQGKPDTHLLTPRVGERFYVHVLTAVVAPFSVSDTYQMQVLLPNGLTPSIQSDTDVQCAITNTSNVQTRLMSASECQDPVQFGLYRQFPPVALAEGEVAHFFFPVVASKAFNGGTDIIQLVANPISNPQTALPDPLVSNNEVFVLPAAAPSTAPGAPTGVSATPGNGSAQVSWNAPGSNGGSAITGYTVTSNPGAKTCTTTGGLSCSVGGLSNGTSYTFTVRAKNGVGTGPASSASAAVVPRTTPGAPTGVAAQPGNTSALVSWAAPASNGGSAITGYTVTSNPDNKTCTTTGALSCTVGGLSNGTSYTFTVRATNGVGTGLASGASAAVTPKAVPSPPLSPTATAGNASATVKWSTPVSTSGSPITGYIATASPGGRTCTTTGALQCVVTGLTNGVGYTFTVRATNAAGSSPSSAATAKVTPSTVPAKVRTLRAAFPRAKVTTVTWLAPASSGGAALVRYDVRWKKATATRWSAWASTRLVRARTITGLLKGVAYDVQVRAVNARGAGLPLALRFKPTK